MLRSLQILCTGPRLVPSSKLKVQTKVSRDGDRNRFRIISHILITEPNDCPAMRFKEFCSPRIVLFSVLVVFAIDFHVEFMKNACEVCVVGPDGVLPPEL